MRSTARRSASPTRRSTPGTSCCSASIRRPSSAPATPSARWPASWSPASTATTPPRRPSGSSIAFTSRARLPRRCRPCHGRPTSPTVHLPALLESAFGITTVRGAPQPRPGRGQARRRDGRQRLARPAGGRGRRQGPPVGQAPVRARARGLAVVSVAVPGRLGVRRAGGPRKPVTVQGGLLRMETPGNGHIVDITPGVASVVQTAGVDRGVVSVFATGSTVAVTTMEYEPGGVHDLQALLDRLIPSAGDYEHNRLNHDTQLPRPSPRRADRTLGDDPRRRRATGARNLAAGRADRLRRPSAPADGDGAGPVLGAGAACRPAPAPPVGSAAIRPARAAPDRRPHRSQPSLGAKGRPRLAQPRAVMLLGPAGDGPSPRGGPGAILTGPLRDRNDLGRALGRNPLPEEVRRSLKTQQHAHPSTEPSVEECVQVRRRRIDRPSRARRSTTVPD